MLHYNERFHFIISALDYMMIVIIVIVIYSLGISLIVAAV